MLEEELLARFPAFAARTQITDGCWVWTGNLRERAYGMFSTPGPPTGRRRYAVRAHRFAWEAVNGPIPEGLEIDHLCRNHSCVRPSHLEAVTHKENCRRGLVGENSRVKTACPAGHPYDRTNVRGQRVCSICIREQEARRRRGGRRDGR